MWVRCGQGAATARKALQVLRGRKTWYLLLQGFFPSELRTLRSILPQVRDTIDYIDSDPVADTSSLGDRKTIASALTFTAVRTSCFIT